MLRGLGAALVALCGCAAASHPQDPAGRCAGGDASRPEDLARLAGCRRIAGDLAISGAAVADLEPLSSLTEVAGDLFLGPTSRLGDLRGLRRLAAVGGDLRVSHNFALGGLYLNALARVGGDLEVEGNLALVGASLARLRAVGGTLRVAGNGGLERLDLSSLAEVGGDLSIEGGRALVVALPDAAEVRGARHMPHPGSGSISAP